MTGTDLAPGHVPGRGRPSAAVNATATATTTAIASASATATATAIVMGKSATTSERAAAAHVSTTTTIVIIAAAGVTTVNAAGALVIAMRAARKAASVAAMATTRVQATMIRTPALKRANRRLQVAVKEYEKVEERISRLKMKTTTPDGTAKGRAARRRLVRQRASAAPSQIFHSHGEEWRRGGPSTRPRSRRPSLWRRQQPCPPQRRVQ
jgi:hypothetical protein